MWIKIDDDYLTYLRENGDHRVPKNDYGKNKFKPFFRLFSLDKFVYITSVTSPKEKYKYFKEDLDFTKLKDKNNNLIGVVHTNFMFPVLEKNIKVLTDSEIFEILGGKGNNNNKYVSRSMERLNNYKSLIREKRVYEKAVKHYLDFEDRQLKDHVKNRSLDFKFLEATLVKYEFEKVFKDYKIEVLKSQNRFFVDVDDTRYTVKHADLYYLEGLKKVHEEELEQEYEYPGFHDDIDYDM